MHWYVRLSGPCVISLVFACSGDHQPATSHAPTVRVVGATCDVDSATRLSGLAPVLCAELFIRKNGYTLDTASIDTTSIRTRLTGRTLGQELAYRHGQLDPRASWECRGMSGAAYVVLFRYDSAWVTRQHPIRIDSGPDTVTLRPALQPLGMTGRFDSLGLWDPQVPESLAVLQHLGCVRVASNATAGRQPN